MHPRTDAPVRGAGDGERTKGAARRAEQAAGGCVAAPGAAGRNVGPGAGGLAARTRSGYAQAPMNYTSIGAFHHHRQPICSERLAASQNRRWLQPGPLTASLRNEYVRNTTLCNIKNIYNVKCIACFWQFSKINTIESREKGEGTYSADGCNSRNVCPGSWRENEVTR